MVVGTVTVMVMVVGMAMAMGTVMVLLRVVVVVVMVVVVVLQALQPRWRTLSRDTGQQQTLPAAQLPGPGCARASLRGKKK